jgi:hypothetical protein
MGKGADMRLKLGMLALLILIPVLAQAQGPNQRPFGIGLTLGEPAGITAKLWFNKKNSLQMAVGFGYYPYYGGAFYADYLYNVFNLLPATKKTPFDLVFYMGIGGKLGMWHHRPHAHHDHVYDVGIGVRIPIGTSMIFTRAPFDIFLEIVPTVSFIHPEPFWFDFDAALGGRFYF